MREIRTSGSMRGRRASALLLLYWPQFFDISESRRDPYCLPQAGVVAQDAEKDAPVIQSE